MLIGNLEIDKLAVRTHVPLGFTVNVAIYAGGGGFRENGGRTFYVGVIFTILLLFPS